MMKNCKDCRNFEAHERGNLCWADCGGEKYVELIADEVLEGEECCKFIPKDYQVGDVFEARLVIHEYVKHKSVAEAIIKVEETGTVFFMDGENLDKLKFVERKELTQAGEEAREMSS